MPEIVPFDQIRREIEEQRASISTGSPLDGGGGGPHDPTMESRVSRLESGFEQTRRDLDEIKADLKLLIQKVDGKADKQDLFGLPTKRDLADNLKWIVGSSVAVVALFVGVLAYLQDQRVAGSAQSPAPIVIQIPSLPQAPAPAGESKP